MVNILEVGYPRMYLLSVKNTRSPSFCRKYYLYLCYFSEPINIFQAVNRSGQDLCVPIRLCYHRAVHYNSLVDPSTASIGKSTKLRVQSLIPNVSYRNDCIKWYLINRKWQSLDLSLTHYTLQGFANFTNVKILRRWPNSTGTGTRLEDYGSCYLNVL